MSVLTRFLPPERGTIVADALLFATAAGGAALGLVTLIAEETTDSGWYEPVSMALVLAVVLLCPLAAWLLHGRRAERATVPGAAVGFVVGGLVVWALILVIGGLAFVVSWATAEAVSVGLAALLIASAVGLALVVWLVADAVRDLARQHRHVGLDVGRIVATVVVAATGVGAAWWAWRNPGEDPGELLAFGLAIGVVGATGALGADVASRLARPVTQG